jgi:anhydro-N-acetylmuramic acid kinase
MNKKEIYAIGLMSGTSLDGLDLVYVKFIQNTSYEFEILQKCTSKYSSGWKHQLKEAIHLDSEKLAKLDLDYGNYLAEKVLHFIQENAITNIDFIASHGHTIFHQPEKGITLQIGNGQQIASQTGVITVSDFRTQDVQLGGQGAPLVPIGDRLLFGNYDACMNLGGFANISFEENERRIAHDISPVNVVLNHFSRKLGYDYDEEGKLASEGVVHHEVLEQLNRLEFYQLKPPKSLGIEWVHSYIFPIVRKIDSVQDTLRTFVEHAAIQLGKNINQFNSVLCTGGGVYNHFLMDRIRFHSNANLTIPNQEIIEYKEALIFAFLGLLKLQNKVNCLSSVTGSSKDHSSGVIFRPN